MKVERCVAAQKKRVKLPPENARSSRHTRPKHRSPSPSMPGKKWCFLIVSYPTTVCVNNAGISVREGGYKDDSLSFTRVAGAGWLQGRGKRRRRDNWKVVLHPQWCKGVFFIYLFIYLFLNTSGNISRGGKKKKPATCCSYERIKEKKKEGPKRGPNSLIHVQMLYSVGHHSVKTNTFRRRRCRSCESETMNIRQECKERTAKECSGEDHTMRAFFFLIFFSALELFPEV